MTITKVKLLQNGYAVNDLIFVPNDEKNAEYQQVQVWIEQGGVFDNVD